MKLKSLVESNHKFDLFIQVLIVISLVSFSIETIPDLPHSVIKTLRWIEITSVAIFTVEYLLRIIVADNRFKFLFSFFGIVDLLAILPFYLALGVDLRSVRLLRLLRLFRAFKLVRYSQAIQRFHRALKSAKEELVLFFFVMLILLYFSAVGIYYCEHDSQPDKFRSVPESLWWAVATLTTVGYGDVYPVTVGGRIFTFLILLIGLGVISVPSGIVATALQEARKIDQEKISDPS